jgi:hypothetical protein
MSIACPFSFLFIQHRSKSELKRSNISFLVLPSPNLTSSTPLAFFPIYVSHNMQAEATEDQADATQQQRPLPPAFSLISHKAKAEAQAAVGQPSAFAFFYYTYLKSNVFPFLSIT